MTPLRDHSTESLQIVNIDSSKGKSASNPHDSITGQEEDGASIR